MSVNSSDKHLHDDPFLKRMGIGLGLTLWVAFAFFLAQAVLFVLIRVFNFFGGTLTWLNDAVLNTILMAVIYALTLSIIILVTKLRKVPLPSQRLLGVQRLPSWKDIALAPVAYIPYLFLAGILLVVAAQFLPGFELDQTQDVGFDNVARQFEYLAAFLTLVVLAPIAEEVLFRGYLYGKLRQHLGLILPILLTSICFGALHLQLNVAINVFALSVVLCLLREVTGSIWSGIILHMLKNGIAFYALFVAPMLV